MNRQASKELLSRLYDASVELQLSSLVDALQDWTHESRSDSNHPESFDDPVDDHLDDQSCDFLDETPTPLAKDAYDDLEGVAVFDDVEVKQEVEEVGSGEAEAEASPESGKRWEACPQCGTVLRRSNLARHIREHCIVQR